MRIKYDGWAPVIDMAILRELQSYSRGIPILHHIDIRETIVLSNGLRLRIRHS